MPTKCLDIQILVANLYALSVDDLHTRRRDQPVALARQVCMHLMRVRHRMTLTKIGEVFDRDHTTVMHACREVPAILAKFPTGETAAKVLWLNHALDALPEGRFLKRTYIGEPVGLPDEQ